MIVETNEQYHANPAVSKSHLDKFAISPFHYWAHYLNPDRPQDESTPAQIIGTATHFAILEPDLFATRYVRRPDGMNGNSNAYKDWKLQQDRLGLTTLNGDSFDRCLAIRDAVHKNVQAKRLLQGGVAERSVYARCPETGLDIKCRPDYLGGVCVDLKSTARISASDFARSVANYRYFVQQPWYQRVIKLQHGETPEFQFLVFESDYPYSVAVYKLEDEDVKRGELAMMRELRLLAEHKEHDFWPDLSEGVQTIALPIWCRNAEDSKTFNDVEQ